MQAISVANEDLSGFDKKLPLSVRFATLWSKYVPRGKGAVPRRIGRSLPDNFRGAVRTNKGALMAIESSSLDMYCIIQNEGEWSATVLDACLRYLKPGDVFYDIGGNIGFISIEAAKSFNGNLRVYTFEPQASLARAIARSAALNHFDNLHVYSTLVGRSSGEATLFLPDGSMQASTVIKAAGAREMKLPIISLDEAVANGEIEPPNVIKIDVEGAERDVIVGAAKTIATHKPVLLFESFAAPIEGVDYTRRDLCEMILGLAPYRLLALRDDKLDPFTSDAFYTDESFDDIVAEPI